MKVEESLNVTFDESPPPTKLSPLVDDDVGEEESIENNTKVVNNSNEEDESIEVDEVINIKESKNHPLEQVIGLRVADFHTSNHLEDDFTPLKTIRRLCSVFERISYLGFKGETSKPKGRLTTFAVMCRAYRGKPTINLFCSFLNLGRAGDWLTLSNRGSADVPIALVKPITHLANWKGSFFYVENKIIPSDYPELLIESNKFDKKSFWDKVLLHPELDPLYD
ncbi:hypothetical protein Tco_0908484 [Tanacetum coccineum]|uniref:Initiator binding domain-containing protein n=1 Tax=Tanacetum coccineum TaxID=301880 RepID=A0ABQ5CTR6_9ASTR